MKSVRRPLLNWRPATTFIAPARRAAARMSSEAAASFSNQYWNQGPHFWPPFWRARRGGDALRVVARRKGDHALGPHLGVERRDGRPGATELEAAGMLQAFGLHQHAASGDLVEEGRGKQRGAAGVAIQPPRRGLDTGDIHGELVLSVRRRDPAPGPAGCQRACVPPARRAEDGAMIERRHETDGTVSRAVYSPCERYRYGLERVWGTGPMLLYVMLNPSTADELRNDPTIERCQRRAVQLGFGGMQIANLFGWRATRPQDLRRAKLPVGPENDALLKDWHAGADMTLAAWGVHGAHLGRGREIAALVGRQLAQDERAARSRMRPNLAEQRIDAGFWQQMQDIEQKDHIRRPDQRGGGRRGGGDWVPVGGPSILRPRRACDGDRISRRRSIALHE